MKLKISKPFIGSYPITFRFGESPSWYVKVVGYPHNGVDFSMPVGVPIYACDDGIVSYTDNLPDNNGCGVNITHSWGLSQYWHLSWITARQGTVIKRGQKIGESGDTGFATGPHLHFGVKVTGEENITMRGWSDPLLYLSDLPAEPIPEPIEPRYYIVRFGDSLWKIAEKFYKRGEFWRKIYEANKDNVKDPCLIFPFQRLLIP